MRRGRPIRSVKLGLHEDVALPRTIQGVHENMVPGLELGASAGEVLPSLCVAPPPPSFPIRETALHQAVSRQEITFARATFV